MPNLVNTILYQELERDLKESGSLLFLGFDKLTVQQDGELRSKLRELGVEYRVVKNRLATKVMKSALDIDVTGALHGKCGVVFAPEEKAISAAKIVRETMRPLKKNAPVELLGAVIEGEPVLGEAAATIPDMPDRDTVRQHLATAISGPARQLATVLDAVPASLARALQAKLDKDGQESS